MRENIGADWQAHIHHKHRLMVARPLVYCSVCGRFASGRRHLRGLVGVCKGKPELHTTYEAYFRYLGQGKHPTTMDLLEPRETAVHGNVAGAPDAEASAMPLRKIRKTAGGRS